MSANNTDAKQLRLALANQFINHVASCGHQLFRHKGSGRIAGLQLIDDQVHVIDESTLIAINTHSEDEWEGFHHGGGLRDFMMSIRDFVIKGRLLRHEYFTPDNPGERPWNHWGYEDAELLSVRDTGQKLGLITIDV